MSENGNENGKCWENEKGDGDLEMGIFEEEACCHC